MMKSTATPYTLEDWAEELASAVIEAAMEEEKLWAEYKQEMREAEEEYQEWLAQYGAELEAEIRQTEQWLENPANFNDPMYWDVHAYHSDIYKDLNGIRPRWYNPKEEVKRKAAYVQAAQAYAEQKAKEAKEHAERLAWWAEDVAEGGYGCSKYYLRWWC